MPACRPPTCVDGQIFSLLLAFADRRPAEIDFDCRPQHVKPSTIDGTGGHLESGHETDTDSRVFLARLAGHQGW